MTRQQFGLAEARVIGGVVMEPVVVESYDFDAGRVVALRGELDACTCRGLDERLRGPAGSLIVVDLGQVTFLDSSGLGLIHAARRKAIQHGGNLVVCKPAPAVLRVLEITGLDRWVTDWDPAWSKGAEPSNGSRV
jgi:anti-anti-sigma factor